MCNEFDGHAGDETNPSRTNAFDIRQDGSMILCLYMSLPDSTYVGVVYMGKF